MENATLVPVSIASNQALSEQLRADLRSLRSALAGQEGIEIADMPLGGMGSIDPDTLQFLFDIAQKGGEILATVAAKEVCAWLWSQLRNLSGLARPSAIALTIGKTKIDLSPDPTPEEIEATVQLAAAAIRATAKARAAEPGP